MRFSCRHEDLMYPESPSPKTRKRGREDDDDPSLYGFSEHRRIIRARENTMRSGDAVDLISQNQTTSSLAIRPSTDSPPRPRSNAMSVPRSSVITPNGSETDDLSQLGWTKPLSSSQSTRYYGDGPISSQASSLPEWPNSSPVPGSQGSEEQDAMDVDEMMHDGPQFSQHSQNESSFGHSDRIPTPINGHFSSAGRSSNHNYGLAIEEATSRLKHDRRLPSPISEDESSQHNGAAKMQMDAEVLGAGDQTRTSQVKHSVKNWGHVSMGVSDGSTRRLAMGYRSDCEKCQQKVLGHSMHLVS